MASAGVAGSPIPDRTAKGSRLSEMARTGIAVPPPTMIAFSGCDEPLLWRRHVGDCPILVVSSP
jgi:hypothetical protein